ncbi:MAG: hypothetical protein WC071_12700 [Victivallaceae bacterium]
MAENSELIDLIGTISLSNNGGAFDVKMKQLTAQLKEQMSKASSIDEKIIESLKKVGYEI